MAKLIELLGQRIPAEYLAFLTKFSLPVSIVLVAVLVVFALFGYKLFKIEMAVTGALAFGVAGFCYIAPLIVKIFGNVIPKSINVYVITGIVCAVIGAVLAVLIRKFAIFTSGAAVGFSAGWAITLFLGNCNPDSEFLGSTLGRLIIGSVAGIALGTLFLFMFKPIFIVSTSIGGMIAVGYLIPTCVMSLNSPVIIGISMAVGGVLGILTAVYQFKSNRDRVY